MLSERLAQQASLFQVVPACNCHILVDNKGWASLFRSFCKRRLCKNGVILRCAVLTSVLADFST